MGYGRSLRRGGELLLGLWEELKQGWRALPWALGGALTGVEISSLGIGRSLRRGAELFLGLWEELKQGWKIPPWALGGA